MSRYKSRMQLNGLENSHGFFNGFIPNPNVTNLTMRTITFTFNGVLFYANDGNRATV